MDTSPARTMNLQDWLLLITLSVLWGGSFFFNSVALRELPPFTVVALRVGLAAVILLVVMRALGLKVPREGSVLLAFLAMGILNNVVPFCLIVWGQTRIASGLASILNATTPLFAVLAAHVLTADEKLTPGRSVGVIVGFLGVVLMVGAAALQNLGINVLAQIAVLAAAASYALAGIFGRRFRAMGVTPMVTATGQVVGSAIVLLPTALVLNRPWELPMPGMATWGAVIGVAALSTALGYIIYFRILARAGATNLMLVTFLIPVSSILLGAAFLGERLGPQHFIGMGMIGIGLAAIDGRLIQFWRRSEPRRAA